MSLQLIGQLLKETGQAWIDHKAARLGAAIAFYSVLSLSPLLILVLAMASTIWHDQAAQGQIAHQMQGLIGNQGADVIKNILAAAAAHKFGGVIAALVGVVSLLFSASAVFGELQDSMNMIWHVHAPEGKSWLSLLRERFLSFVMVMGSGFLLLVSLVMSAALSALSHYVTGLVPGAVLAMQAVNLIISFGVISFIFALIFKTIPDCNIPWRSVWPGALLTAALFITGKGLIGLYLGHAGIASSYGAAGSIVVLLLWIYYSAQILFFGAEFTYVYSSHYKLHPTENV